MALLQHPENPFESMYSPSVLAAQNSASFIIRTTARYLEKAPEAILRNWDVWVDIPSAAVSISILGFTVCSTKATPFQITAGSIAIHAPNVPSSAMSDLDLAIRILERGTDYSWYARVALVSWMKLRQRSACLTIISALLVYSLS
jgi:hypothetical protein